MVMRVIVMRMIIVIVVVVLPCHAEAIRPCAERIVLCGHAARVSTTQE
ncbi:hypothetical protein GCM10017653_13630 [Ancylobacter defluvii]|uniref:Uncharacterized protein n=1 Tax=Ancylobacter defluvii TaxID=1282440 RepID=A0A9W6JVY1_9HYPH|nr:hypothetical protein GCM10017653_13630 [Ancylobacter defluvii]